MKKIFEEITINKLTLPNRIFRSATWEGMCDDDGRPTDQLIQCYRDMTEGGIGLIISGYTYVVQSGKQLPGKMGLHTNDFEDDYRKMFNAIHEAGGKIAIQLVHAGGQANPKVSGCPQEAPSAIEAAQFDSVPEAMSETRIAEVITAFGNAAERAANWGADAVQLHGAHGYLLNQFLSPLTNQRDDNYGGSIENRARFSIDVYNEIRKRVGPDYPVMIKLNACDELEGGLQIDDALYAAKALSKAGIDLIEVSSGTGASGDKTPVRTGINKPEKEAYNLTYAQKIKEAVNCKIIAVGGFRSLETAENAVADTGLDGISLSRPLIREPNLAARWKSGDTSPSTCISCNKCFVPGLKKKGIYCVVDKD